MLHSQHPQPSLESSEALVVTENHSRTGDEDNGDCSFEATPHCGFEGAPPRQVAETSVSFQYLRSVLQSSDSI
jgi:hypothetical protein